MKLLVIRDQHEFATQLREQLSLRAEIILPVPVAWDAIGESVDLNRLVEQQSPDFIICAVHLPINANKKIFKKFRSVVEQIERCSRKYSLPLIFISSGAVFDGSKLSYSEKDSYSSNNEYGKFYADLEAHIIKKVRRHVILRTTWLFSSYGENFLTSVISYASENALISVNSAGKGCPTAIQDLARVVIAILLQLDLGADNWGVYHYASSDAAIGFQFVEAIVMQASQYDESIDISQLNFEHNDVPAGAFYFEPVVLKCQKLLDTFGIHQRSWRSMLTSTVKEHFEWVEVENE